MRAGRIVGVALQALILGTLLFLALAELIGSTGAPLFRYQGY